MQGSTTAATDYGNWVPTRMITVTAALSLVFAGLAFLLPVLAAVAAVFLVAFLYFLYARHLFSPKGGDIQTKVRGLVLERIAGWDGTGRALDIGCGNGALAVRIAAAYPHSEVVGIDYWGASWEYSQRACVANAEAEGVADRASFEKASASSLPFDDESFDVVVSNMTFHEVKDTADKRAVVKEALRVLRRGGRFAFQDLFLVKSIYGEVDDLLAVVRSWGIESVEFANTSNADFCPKALKLPFMLGRAGVVYGRK